MRRKFFWCLAIATVLVLSSCGFESSSQRAKTTVDALNTSNEEAGSGAENETWDRDPLELKMPTVAEEELLTTYDPGIAVRLDELGVETDDCREEYTYTTIQDGEYTEHVWEVDEENTDMLFTPPGVGNTYHVKYYDRSGKTVMDITMHADSTGVGCEGIDVFEREDNGKLKIQYHYIYSERDWAYILSTAYLYSGGNLIGDVRFNTDTYKRHRICIYSADDNYLTVKEIVCDSDGNLAGYYTYEYNEGRKVIRTEEYDTNDCLVGAVAKKYNDRAEEIWVANYDANNQVESSAAREYDDAGHLLKIEYYDSDETLIAYRIYTWTEDFALCTYEACDAQGNVTASGQYYP